ncbi:YibE/F family protein [Candidatus Kaiserbacteria bacterium]|nr:YibE/F family protein [Candidatus Kaiserbacteria bacterium]
MKKFVLFLFVFLQMPFSAFAQQLHEDYQGTWHGKVIEVLDDETRIIPGTDTEQKYQTIRAEVLDGPKEGEVIRIENDYLELDEGDRFYFNYYVYIDGTEEYGVLNIDRRIPLLILFLVFVSAVLLLGGWQGLRSLVALFGSVFAIFYILMPGILAGWNPLVISVVVASGILFVAIFFTHGFNRESVVAYSGTMLAVLLTGLLAILSVHLASLSGFADEAATYLNFNTRGALDFTALLIGAIIIGVLGVLDDIAVTQAAVVTELFDSNPSLTRRDVYRRALRVGREHVGALVNTLVLAYTGASLPLLLHFYMSSSSLSMAISSELFATEIVRTIVGSVGLIMTVPFVTLLSVIYLKNYKSKHSHSHSHGHKH